MWNKIETNGIRARDRVGLYSSSLLSHPKSFEWWRSFLHDTDIFSLLLNDMQSFIFQFIIYPKYIALLWCMVKLPFARSSLLMTSKRVWILVLSRSIISIGYRWLWIFKFSSFCYYDLHLTVQYTSNWKRRIRNRRRKLPFSSVELS